MQELNALRFYQEVYQKKAATTIKMITSPHMAEQIRSNIISHFSKGETKEKIASCLILLTDDKKKVLCVQRRNTRKWDGSLMLGSAEQQEKGENEKEALLRGIKEELLTEPKKLCGACYLGEVKPNEIEESFGLTAKFFTAKAKERDLKQIIEKINSGASYELINANLVNVEILNTIQNMQPHYKVIIAKAPINHK